MAFCYFRWEDYSDVLKPVLGNRKNFYKFLAVANKLWWEAYISTLR